MKTVIYIDEFVKWENPRHCKCGKETSIQELNTYGCCEMCWILTQPAGFDVEELCASGSLDDLVPALLAVA